MSEDVIYETAEEAGSYDTTEGKVPNVTKHPAHAALRTSLAHVGKPLFLATAVLPKALRDRLRGELVKEVLAGVASSMDGVLSVEAAGLALGNSGSGDAAEAPSELAGEFLCESEVGAKAVFALADSKRNEWKRDLTLRLVGVGRVVDALELRQEGRAVRFGLKMPLAEMVALVERVMELRGKSFGAQKSGTPDEVIPSRPQPPKPNP